jgi:TM2 domain-containing membrane protein YozV
MHQQGFFMKDKLTSFLLCLFFGTLGAHRFYLGRVKSGVLMILTLGGVGVWYLVDLVLIGCGKLQRKEPPALSPVKVTLRNKQ